MKCNKISSHLEQNVLENTVKNVYIQYYGAKNLNNHLKNKAVQTDYRESESQTSPWQSLYRIAGEHVPETLMLSHFRWGMELPAGSHELEIINRMRKKRGWEKILPPMDRSINIKTRSILISDLEDDEWLFRENEIHFLMNLRMDLVDKLLKYKESKKKKQTQNRFKTINERLNNCKQNDINNIRNKFSRKLRKLSMKNQRIKIKQEKQNVIQLHNNETLSLYSPKLRRSSFEENYYEKKDSDIDGVKAEVISSDFLSTTKKIHDITSKLSIKICPRVSKRNEKKLLELCKKLESMSIKFEYSDSCTLMKHKQKIVSLPSTPCGYSTGKVEDDGNLSFNLLRTFVQGRAVHCMMYKERNRFGDFIEELQAAEVLDNSKGTSSNMIYLKVQELEKERTTLQDDRVKELLDALEGKVISKILIFLNEGLLILQKEREIHKLLFNAKNTSLVNDNTQGSKDQSNIRKFQESFEKYIIVLAESMDDMIKHMNVNIENIEVEKRAANKTYNFTLPKLGSVSFNNEKICLYTFPAVVDNEILYRCVEQLLLE